MPAALLRIEAIKVYLWKILHDIMDPFSNADPDSLAALRSAVRPSGFALKADGF